MVSAKGLIMTGKKTEQLLDFYPEERPIAYQLLVKWTSWLGLLKSWQIGITV